MATENPTLDLGIFPFDKETKNTVRFGRERNGRPETQYVQKSDLPGGKTPSAVRIILEFIP